MKRNIRLIALISILAIVITGFFVYWSADHSHLPLAPTAQPMMSHNVVANSINPNVVINPRSKKPDFTLQKWINDITRVQGNTVHIELGDRAGGLGTDDDMKLSLFLLSPVLKMHPTKTIFKVSWSYSAAMKTSLMGFAYNRAKGIVTSQSDMWPKPMKPDSVSITGVRDSMIHVAASQYDSYTNVKNY